jgi:tetratricopeptide (TPR) repeat protein
MESGEDTIRNPREARMKALTTGFFAAAAIVIATPSGASADDKHTLAFIDLNTAYMNRCAQGAAAASKSGKFDAEGFEYCTLSLDTEPLSRLATATTYNNRGILSLVRGDHDRAKADFDAAIRTDSSFGAAYVSRSWANVMSGRYNDAVADANSAIAKGAATAQAHYNRAAAYEGLGNGQRAYRDYLKASQLDPAWALPKTELARFTVKPR